MHGRLLSLARRGMHGEGASAGPDPVTSGTCRQSTTASCVSICAPGAPRHRAQAVWRESVFEEVKYGRWSPALQLDLPIVDVVLRIGGRLGLEVMTCGGLNGVVHRAFKCLQLLPMLTAAERLALEGAPEMTLVARPTQDQPPPPDDDNTFIVAAIEHIDQRVKKLADSMAVGLLLRAQLAGCELEFRPPLIGR